MESQNYVKSIVTPLSVISKMHANGVAAESKQLRIGALMKNAKNASCKERMKSEIAS